MSDSRPIGLFDSGLGGLTLLHQLRKTMPNEHLVYFGDSLHNPYGEKSRQEVIERCITICDAFLRMDCKAIIIACNTATSASVELLRKRYSIPIIGMEPAIKPALERSGSQKVAVWATELTLHQPKFQRLLKKYQKDHKVILVAAPKLVRLIEEGHLDDQDAYGAIDEYLSMSGENPDSIVLGCTHFVGFRKILENISDGNIRIIDGHEGTINHLKKTLESRDELSCSEGSLAVFNSDPEMIAPSLDFLNQLEEL